MKNIVIILFFLQTVFIAKGQIICEPGPLQKNVKPDTITTFLFSNRSLLVAGIPNVKATSNFSFESTDFDLAWTPVNTSNIKGFIDRSIANIKPVQITDTVSCRIFGQDYTTLVMKSKRKLLLLLFLNRAGEQDVFVASISNKRKIKQSIDFIEANLSAGMP